jgi:uncharacterized protein YegL
MLIDVSESMVGEPVRRMEEGIATIIQTLKTDARAIETVWISIIVFAGQARTIIPLQELVNFYPPKFPIGSGTSLAKGLGHLMYELRKNTVRSTPETKGDWKPAVFLFTDGVPTDNASDIDAVISEWNRNWSRSANLVAISLGESTDSNMLARLTDNLLQFNAANADAYRKFFQWVSDSMTTHSHNIETNNAKFDLAKTEKDILTKITPDKSTTPAVDDNHVVIAAKCTNTRRPYLIKYTKNVFVESSGDIGRHYRLVGAYQVDDQYFELADEHQASSKIHTGNLVGAPACPCCGNQYAFAQCSCGKIHCIGMERTTTCPWCNTRNKYETGEGGFDVNRTQG